MGYFFNDKPSTNKGDITIINIYSLNNRVAKYIKEKLTEMNEKIYSIPVIGRDFSTPYHSMDRTIRLKIYKDMENLNKTVNQLYLIDIDELFHLTTKEYMVYSSGHGNFPRIDSVL